MIKLRASADVIHARLAARELVRDAGLGVMDQTRFSTAVSELGRCALQGKLSSSCELSDQSDVRLHRLQARFIQEGEGPPGIAGVAEVPAVRQLVDVYNVTHSAAGLQVTVQIVRLRKSAR